jgi:magnesium-transporting ATPase (P-type)
VKAGVVLMTPSLLVRTPGVEPLDKDVMKKPPRDPRKPVFPPIMLLAIVVSAVLMVVGTLAVFYTFLEVRRTFHTHTRTRSHSHLDGPLVRAGG